MNWSIILLGTTGDLATRRLIPALYHLFARDDDSSRFIFIGAARDDTSIYELFERAKPHIHHLNQEVLNLLASRSYYQKVDFLDDEDFNILAGKLTEYEAVHGGVNGRLVYLATGSDFFCTITKQLIRSGIIKRSLKHDQMHYRVLYEKPYGHDLESAQEIERCLTGLLNQEQIYRVDHYMTKALVQSLCLIRLSNPLLSAVWSNEYIDHVQIQLIEQDGLEHRGAFYDKTGAIRDVVQNHILQLMAYVTMPLPEHEGMTHRSLSDRRLEVLQKIRIDEVLKGQFKGYHQIEHVSQDSPTETFVALSAYVDLPKWKGVPFYLKTGKYLNKKSTEIHIVLKPITQAIFGISCEFPSNIITIVISPDTGIRLQVNIQKAEEPQAVVPVDMEFCYRCVLGPDEPRSYETLIHDALAGDRSISVEFEEVVILWRLIDEVRSRNVSIHQYQAGSTGPQEADDFAEKNGFIWR